VGFLEKVIDWAVTERQIDPQQVYLTGASNGGMMTYRMLIERPNIVTAGAALIANLPGNDVEFEPPSSSTPVFIMNGSEDRLMPFQGGSIGRNGGRGTVRSSDATRDYFVQVNGAESPPLEFTLPDANPNDNCRIAVESFSAAANDTAPVQYAVMEGGGHVYATVESAGFLRDLFDRWLVGPPCRDAESADLAWEFMSQFTQQ